MLASANLAVRSLVAITSLVAIPAVAVWSFSAPPPTPVKRGPKTAASARSGGPFARGLFNSAAAAPSVGGLFESSAEASSLLPVPPLEKPARSATPAGQVQRTTALAPLKSPTFWSESSPAPSRPKRDSAKTESDDTAAAAPSADGVAVLVDREDHRLQPTGRRMTEPARTQPPRQRLPQNDVPAAVPPEGVDNEEFSALEERLRALGATHYRLETWGAQGELFRFRAMMSLSSRTNHNRYFEATDRDAMRAVERVIEQVERWRAGQ